MKKIFLIVSLWFCVAAWALPVLDTPDAKDIVTVTQEAGSLRLGVNNMGYVEQLTEPGISSFMLYQGSSWISARKQRRDALGRRLYWKVYPPTAVNDTLIYEGHPDWNPGMVPAIDSLTTVGFDGDMELMELLPAYNPLSVATNPLVNPDLAGSDVVMKSILGSPAPRPFEIPDPLGTYCFSIPQGGTFETPGFETLSGYFYDYCPFQTNGERDWGSARGSSTHIPLNLAIHRESYAWPLQNYDRMIIIKNTLVNTDDLDPLLDLTVAELVDGDIRPGSWGPEGGIDDVSGYVKGPGYEFAYTRDDDGDGGLSPRLLGHKLIIPGFTGNRSAWYWRAGQGPYDLNPRDLQPSGRTANEKYWLSSGRNPNAVYYVPLRPSADDIMEYEQPAPNDTRFLTTLYGDPWWMDDGPHGRLILDPDESLVYYSVYFSGNNLDDLKVRSQLIESFIASNFNLGNIQDNTCIPYLMEPQAIYPSSINLQWHSYTDPDHFEVMTKEFGSPASSWNVTNVSGTTRTLTLNSLDPSLWYEIKVGAAFYPDANEVYLESVTSLFNINQALDTEDPLQPPQARLKVYPNPFREAAGIDMQLKESGAMALEVYNLKGQKVRTIMSERLSAGDYRQHWDGNDDRGTSCGSGVYLLKLSSGSRVTVAKVLLLR